MQGPGRRRGYSFVTNCNIDEKPQVVKQTRVVETAAVWSAFNSAIPDDRVIMRFSTPIEVAITDMHIYADIMPVDGIPIIAVASCGAKRLVVKFCFDVDGLRYSDLDDDIVPIIAANSRVEFAVALQPEECAKIKNLWMSFSYVARR